MLNEILEKLASAVILFATTFICTILPYKFKASSKKTLRRVACFCGGLFLGLCFLHLIPDVLRSFNEIPKLASVQKRYPFAELIICSGLLLIVVIEKLATVIQVNRKSKKCTKHKECCKNEEDENTSLLENSVTLSYKSNLTVDNNPQIINNYNNEDGNTILIEEGQIRSNGIGRKKSTVEKSMEVSFKTVEERRNRLRTFVLIIALMIHSLFEGLTVGMQDTTVGLIELVALLAFHKSLLGFSLGVNMVNSGSELKTQCKQALLFAVSSPVGIIVGLIIVTTTTTYFNEEISPILIALATGSFIYITFFEILVKEMSNTNGDDLFIVLANIFGFVLFAVVTIIPDMQE